MAQIIAIADSERNARQHAQCDEHEDVFAHAGVAVFVIGRRRFIAVARIARVEGMMFSHGRIQWSGSRVQQDARQETGSRLFPQILNPEPRTLNPLRTDTAAETGKSTPDRQSANTDPCSPGYGL